MRSNTHQLIFMKRVAVNEIGPAVDSSCKVHSGETVMGPVPNQEAVT